MKIAREFRFSDLVLLMMVTVPVAMVLISEHRWSYINRPDGRFTNVHEYLEYGRLPQRVEKVEVDGKIFLVAYSPMDCWWAIPSGPAAYVFDESGELTDWSPDSGDDWKFEREWPRGQQSSLDELKTLAAASPEA